MNCEEIYNGQTDTTGNPIKFRVCYCGTTACTKLSHNDYLLPKDLDESALKKHYRDTLKSKFV